MGLVEAAESNRVQTRSPKAFYTFILRLVLLLGMAADGLTLAAVSLISRDGRDLRRTIP